MEMNKNRTTTFGFGQDLSFYWMAEANRSLINYFEMEEILIFGKTLTTLSYSFNPPPFCLQETALLLHTDTTLPTGDHLCPPPTSKSLFCSALLSLVLPFSAKSQIGGWGVFCGPNKRAKVVRTLLYESVGGGGQWPKQLVFQAWAYTDQQAWAA